MKWNEKEDKKEENKIKEIWKIKNKKKMELLINRNYK